MRRLLVIFILASFAYPSRAQQVVIDPSQIAASATNAAEQVDYMLDQLGELANLGDQLSSVRGYIDEVFGDDGVGSSGRGYIWLIHIVVWQKPTQYCKELSS